MFGIDSGGFGTILILLVLFLIVTYLALIYWTYLDAKRRIEDPFLVACAVAASVFPFVGTVVYTIVRPPEFLEDREERELELRAAEIQLRQLIEQSCPHCEYPISANYLRCPNCERRLRNPCRKCRKPLDPKWGVCPFCETEVRKRRADRESTRPERARAPRASAGQRSGSGSREQRTGARSDGSSRKGSKSGARSERDRDRERQTRREQRAPARSSGTSEQRSTGGASGSFPGTDRKH
jgi:hypothetical protein